MPSLIISRDSHFYKVYALQGRSSIGRSHGNDIVLDAAGVSRLHARIEVEGDAYFLTDAGSTNGTLVAGRRITRLDLIHGTSFRIHDFLFAFVEELPSFDGPGEIKAAADSRCASAMKMDDTVWISPSAKEDHGLQQKVFRLLQMVSALHSASHDTDLGAMVLDALFDITGAKRGCIAIRRQGEALKIVHARGFDRLEVRTTESLVVIEEVLRRGAVLHKGFSVNEAQPDSAWPQDLKSGLCVPLRFDGHLIGCLYLDHPDHAGIFSDVHRDLVVAVADHTAEALVSGKKPADGLNDNTERFAHRLKRAGIIVRSPKTIKVFQDAQTIAHYNVSVLIYGETGTGKEVIARYIHDQSGREGQFIARNCSAISASMFESELFGHEKGAFTGADESRPGMLALADRGTIFLDEIGDMPAELQVKLLRAIQEHEVWPVGGRAPVKIDVRVISATHKDIKNNRIQLNFRDDFYYRLANVEITAPALRERTEDIAPLCHYILEGLSAQHLDGQKTLSISAKAVQLLEAYDWPGNIRELRNVLLQIALRCDSRTIDVRHLKGLQSVILISSEAPCGRVSPLIEVERAHIMKALHHTNGNKSAAAKILQINRNRLNRRLKKLGIDETADPSTGQALPHFTAN